MPSINTKLAIHVYLRCLTSNALCRSDEFKRNDFKICNLQSRNLPRLKLLSE